MFKKKEFESISMINVNILNIWAAIDCIKNICKINFVLNLQKTMVEHLLQSENKMMSNFFEQIKR